MRRAKRRTGSRTTLPGYAIRSRRSIPSTVSSRSISIRAASRERGRAWSATSTRRRRGGFTRWPPHAQWFEDHMPWDPRFRKAEVTGVTARAIEVVIETGDSGPVTPIGINLPNDQAIREQYGSKSVSLANVSEAYERSTPEGLRLEFSWDDAEAARAKRWGARRAGTDDGHARSDRPWVRPDGRRGHRAAASAARRAVFGDRGSARRSRGALLPARSASSSSSGSCPPRSTTTSCGPSTSTTRERRSCSFGASVSDRTSKRTTCATGR